MNIDKSFAPGFSAFCAKTRASYEEWIGLLRAELMNLVYDSSDKLSHEAEAESLGFNTGRIRRLGNDQQPEPEVESVDRFDRCK